MADKKKMKPTEKIALRSTAIGAIAGGALYFGIDGVHWGVALALALIVAGGCYQAELQLTSQERIVDRDHGHQ